MLYKLFKPILFCLPPEYSHHISLKFLSWAVKLGFKQKFYPSKNTVFMGLTFKNPIGLAAGCDKNGDYLAALGSLGFGFIEIGTITPKPQKGNPKPRLFRSIQHKAILNRMGFNNKGVDYLVQNIQKTRKFYSGILGINIGKNSNTPIDKAVDDYLICLNKVYNLADYITINISSPNTQNLRDLQSESILKPFLFKIINQGNQLAQDLKLNSPKPICLKVAPELSLDQIKSIIDICLELKISGLILTNTSTQKEKYAAQGEIPYFWRSAAGGVSGAPLFKDSTELLSQAKQYLKSINLKSIKSHHSLTLIGVGGVDSVQSAQQKIDSGADLVQIYSGLVYQGPGLIGRLIKACR